MCQTPDTLCGSQSVQPYLVGFRVSTGRLYEVNVVLKVMGVIFGVVGLINQVLQMWCYSFYHSCDPLSHPIIKAGKKLIVTMQY